VPLLGGGDRGGQFLALGYRLISLCQLFVDRRCIGWGGALGALVFLACPPAIICRICL
jgi:hypothetical protein